MNPARYWIVQRYVSLGMAFVLSGIMFPSLAHGTENNLPVVVAASADAPFATVIRV